jgi:hypothetical protein
MGRRVVVASIVVAIAYGVGWLGSAVLNDDPCISSQAREIDRYDHVSRWFPARTDCRVTTPSGASRIESGSSEVFLAMFAFALVVGFALLSELALAIRAAAVLIAGAVAFLVIFVV